MIYDSQYNITITGYIIYAIILIATYVWAIHLSAGYLPSFVDDIQKSCVMNCSDQLCSTQAKASRGKHLYLDDPKKSKEIIEQCRFTYWNLIHGIMFGALTFVFPSLWQLNLGISIMWEYYEYAFLDCHDLADLPANTLGIAAGYCLSPYKSH